MWGAGWNIKKITFANDCLDASRKLGKWKSLCRVRAERIKDVKLNITFQARIEEGCI